MAAAVTLVLGGVRSGKSAIAESLAKALAGPTLYVATARPLDGEMEKRIRRHRLSRPADWTTLEEPLDVPGRLGEALAVADPPRVVLIDSLDMWLGNQLLEHEGENSAGVASIILADVCQLLEVCLRSSVACFLVSSEVGHSLVPPYPVGRQFQDLLGEVNQKVAAAASRVYLVVAGIPMQIKGLAVY